MLLKNVFAVICVIGFAVAYESPVFLWGSNSIGKPSLPIVNEADFANVVQPMLERNMVMVFQENGLTAEDFLCSKGQSGQSCFAFLKGVSPKRYYASVENPIEVLQTIAETSELNTVSKTGQLKNSLHCEAGKVVFVDFESSGANRDADLRAHDAAIATINNEISCPTIYLYLSTPLKESAVKSRSRRAIVNGGTVFRNGSQFLIYWSSLIIRDSEQSTNEDIVVENMTVETVDSTNFTVTLSTTKKASLSFSISLNGGYYSMKNIVYNNIKFRASNLEAPTDFSYHCGNLTLAGINTENIALGSPYSLQWNALQFQAPFGRTTNATFVFGDSWDCLSFFSPAILMGFLVILLILLITFTGICWMIDINTMDRFDDPKGKTITINAVD